MRRILLNLSLLAVAASPLAAHASPVSFDQITITNATTTLNYIVPAAPTSFIVDTDPTNGNALIDIELNNVSSAGPLTVYFDTTAYTGGLFDSNNNFEFTTTGYASFFNGSATAPVFTLGASGTGTDGNGLNYTYSIAPAPTAGPAPEPSSLILLGTGALGVVGSLRRRLFA
jgi:hypothetical protein